MDIELYYEEAGNGIPFILLHGNGENGTYFKHQIDYFSKSYRVIAIDTRGHGKSPRGTAAFTMEQFAEDLNCFFEQHNIQKAILLGFSDGANISDCRNEGYDKGKSYEGDFFLYPQCGTEID